VDDRAGRPPMRLAVLVSGGGTTLQSLLDAAVDPDAFGARVVVVGSDRPGCGGLARAERHGIATVVHPLGPGVDRDAWERALVDDLRAHAPDLVVLAGFMRIVTPTLLAQWPDRVLNTHPSLLPAFPGAHAVRDALTHRVRVTGATVHLVDEQVDHGPIVAQRCVAVRDDDTEATLHARIRAVEHVLLPWAVGRFARGEVRIDGRRVIIEGSGEGADGDVGPGGEAAT
jgi:phosphoribosylglycinamide formyltransferase 1